MQVKVPALCLMTVLGLALPAFADQRYVVSGNDRYRIGSTDLQTSISYDGTQDLIVRKDGRQLRLTARAKYTRADATGRVPLHATFVQVMTPSGELDDRTDLDPDYLTVLNQPFAVMLDDATRSELLHLDGRVPFRFPAPMIGGTLQGYLQRGSISPIDARPALAVDFDAAGPMTGALPDRANMSLSGTMRMGGTAYYAVRGPALLLALQETLTISGRLRDRSGSSPVTIVYRRTIKAADSSAPSTEASSH